MMCSLVAQAGDHARSVVNPMPENEGRLLVAQAGDSACVLGRGAGPSEVAMEKHWGLNKREAERITSEFGDKLSIDEVSSAPRPSEPRPVE